MTHKYIIVKDRDDVENAIVFPTSIIHKDVARIHRATDVRVVSAGFCTIHGEVTCWGQSESIGKKCRPDIDTVVLKAGFCIASTKQLSIAVLFEKLKAGLRAVESLIDHSEGVTGLHLNGDVAPWSELRNDGRYREWLEEFDEAMQAITPVK